MDIQNIKQRTARCLSGATYSPRRLALLHTGIALAGSLVLMIVSYLLSRQMAGTVAIRKIKAIPYSTHITFPPLTKPEFQNNDCHGPEKCHQGPLENVFHFLCLLFVCGYIISN